MDFDIFHKWHAGNSYREEAVKGTYDLKNVKLEKHIKGSIPIETIEWKIGVIVGASGSGKTSIAKHLWPNAYYTNFDDFFSHDCFLNDFPSNINTDEIETALCSSGFSEPPSWLKKYSNLSQGQKMRVNIAYTLCAPTSLTVFDEYTSTVDRTVAKIGSYAVSRNIRKHVNKQFIAVTCHFDVVDWLEPDWVYNVDENIFHDYTNTLDTHTTSFGTKIISEKKNCAIPQLRYQSINVQLPCGKSLGTIII